MITLIYVSVPFIFGQSMQYSDFITYFETVCLFNLIPESPNQFNVSVIELF